MAAGGLPSEEPAPRGPCEVAHWQREALGEVDCVTPALQPARQHGLEHLPDEPQVRRLPHEDAARAQAGEEALLVPAEVAPDGLVAVIARNSPTTSIVTASLPQSRGAKPL